MIIKLIHDVKLFYLLFYYQSEGLGDNPQTEDSLVLEFLTGVDTAGFPVWKHIWSIPGQTTQEFQRMEFNIKGANYLHAGFRFRFRNYATLSGNYVLVVAIVRLLAHLK